MNHWAILKRPYRAANRVMSIGEPDISERVPQPERPTRQRRRRWRLWLALGVCLALVSWLVHFAYLRITGRPTPRLKYWEAKLAEVDPLPDGGLRVFEAYNVLDSRSWESTPGLQTGFNRTVKTVRLGPWDGARSDVALVTAIFTSDSYSQAHARLREAVTVGWRDRLGVSPLALSPTVRHYHYWTEWLVAHSRWAREDRADIASAVDDWLTALRLGRQGRRGRFGWAGFSAGGWAQKVASEMMYCASEGAAPIDTHALMQEVDKIYPPDDMPSALLAEVHLSMHCYLESIYVRQGRGWLSISDYVASNPWGWQPRPSRIWNLASPLFHDLATARSAVDRYLAAASDFPDMPAWERAELAQPDHSSDADLSVLDGFRYGEFWRLARALRAHYLARCELDAAVTMLALREYQRVHGSYPEALDALVPDFLPRVPIDYADRQPMRYARTDDGYLLYSIGDNGRDDGGAHDPNSRSRWDEEADPDAVFSTARRPEVRK